MNRDQKGGNASKGRKIVALVLAGERSATDAVAGVSGVSCKALAPVAGKPMIVRVLNALHETGRMDSVVLCGPDRAAVDACPQLHDVMSRNDISWIPAARGLSDSVRAGLTGIDAGALVLVTTADHALLDADILNYFLDRVIDSRAGVSVGLVEYAIIRRACPGVRRTVLKFAEGGYCGCNLYALDGPRARDVISLWQRTQAYRKRPWRMALGLLGFSALARYLSGHLSMGQARRAILDSTGIALDFINLPFPHAGIDVDTPADLALAEEILRDQPGISP